MSKIHGHHPSHQLHHAQHTHHSHAARHAAKAPRPADLEAKISQLLGQLMKQNPAEAQKLLSSLDTTLAPPAGTPADGGIGSLPSGGDPIDGALGKFGGALDGLDQQISGLESKKDLSQSDMLKLQDLMNKEQRLYEMLSSMMKNQHDTQMSVIRNISG